MHPFKVDMATTLQWRPLNLLIYSLFLGSVLSNRPPFVNFGPPSGVVFKDEDTAIGSFLLFINATDTDSTTLTFNTGNQETSELVEIGTATHTGDVWSVKVTLKKSLDRDRSPQTRTLLFEVIDQQMKITGRVSLIVLDVNDNPPLFVDLPYRISLEEGTAMVNKTVFVVRATDPDDGLGGSVVYSMAAQAQGADEKYNKTFAILNKNMGNITLTMELDYETRSYYQYQIFASDQGTQQCPGPNCLCSNVTEPNMKCQGDPAVFIVTVKDVQDTPPFFENLPYLAQVYENAAPGTSFFQVSAMDGDRGVPNKVTYSIVDASKYPFVLNATTGVLTVGAAGLDADQPNGHSYVITVMASEVIAPGQVAGGNTSTTTKLGVTVHDVNDNGPVFSEPVYHASVMENTPRGVPLTIKNTIEVSDKDQNENNHFVLSVVKDGQPYPDFRTLPAEETVVQGLTTVMISVFNSSVLDYETTKNLTFQLKAIENSTKEMYSNTTTIILTIEDMNDNSPIFPNQTTLVKVSENTPVGVVLNTFTATDADSGSYGNVSYSLEDGFGKFNITPESGKLAVMADLDREAAGGTAYSLVVVATDNMEGDEAQRRSTRFNVRVEVLDVNDNAPVFQTHPDTVTVQENAQPKTALMTLTATDKDADLNGKVVYSVLNIQPSFTQLPQPPQQLFAVYPNTGIVYVNASLIGHPGSFNVTFLASDSAPAGEAKNATTLLMVNVRDVNINAPTFVKPNQSLINTTLKIIPNVTVDEEQPAGSLIKQFSATDVDTGENGLVYYSLEPDLPGNFRYFDIGYDTGRLVNRAPLDREQFRMLQINVQAKDQGAPTQLSTVIPFQVFLQDIDDNDPMFPPPATLTLYVGEEQKFRSVGYVNVSTDADQDPENKKACYYIYSGESLSFFFLSKETGDLRLEKVLDRDVTPTIKLVIKVTKDCSPPENQYTKTGANLPYDASDSSLLQVLINVEDINDNPPVFDDGALSVGLLYDKEIGFEVINLAAYTHDEDTPAHSKNKFSLLQTLAGGGMTPPDPPPFKVSVNGSVMTTRLFGAEEKGYFELLVRAYDDDGQSDEATVTIYLVGNLDRVKLVFNKRPNEVQSLKGELVKKLSDALGMTVIADKIATHITGAGTADPERTDVFIHARKSNGQILSYDQLLNAIDYNEEVRKILAEMGSSESLPVIQARDSGDSEPLKKAFIIVAIILSIICLVLLVVLFNTVRRYRRRLRAATTSAFVSQKVEPNNFVPPGTNKYFAAENPLYGKDMKPMDMDRLGSDTDSLDDNAVADEVGSKAPGPNVDKVEEQEMYLELFDEGGPGQGAHLNHLAMVLQEYERENQEGEGDEDDDEEKAPYPPSSHGSDNWKSLANGHAKSDSGYMDEHGGGRPVEAGGIQNLQHTDI